MTNTPKILYFLSIPAIFLYFARIHFTTKVLPIYLITAASYLKEPKSQFSKYISIGLFLSSFGDIFLELEDHYDYPLFIPGLVSFLLAHISYIYAMKVDVEKHALYLLPILGIYYYYVMSKLVPSAEADLRIPILIYGLAICTMGFMAINRMFSSKANSKSALASLAGSLSFVVSDTILAFNKFYVPIPKAKTYVMITYYTAQILIAASVVFTNSERPKKI